MTSTYIGLDAIERRVRAGMTAGVRKSAKQLARKAHDRAPELTGTLAGGIEANEPHQVGVDAVETRVHTGSAADEYAIIQHQRRRGVKYIGDELIAHIPEHLATVAAELQRRL